jgi:arsenate reductase-like glutaredoxin family protein
MKAQVLGLSVDSTDCLHAWAGSLGGITYPLLSDFFPHGQVSQLYGVLRKEGYSERSIFVIDKQGIVRYVDVHDIDDQPDNDEIFRVLNKLEPDAAAVMAAADQAAAAAAPVVRPAADVVIYCTPWCGDCRRARAWLQEHQVAYVEVDISKDREAAKRVRGWARGYETTPTFDIKGRIIVDWKPAEVAKALGL